MAILFILVVTSLFFIRVKTNMKDFEVNYQAGKRLRMAETLYRTQDEHYMFKYFPSAALLYAPLTQLPLDTAKGIWYLLIIAGLTGMFTLSSRMLTEGNPLSFPMTVVTLMVLLKFILREIELGQINALVGFILTLMIWNLALSQKKNDSVGRNWLAGIFWGLGVALKPYALLFFPYLLVKKNWRSLAGGAAFLLISFFAPAFYYGFEGNLEVHREWFETLSGSTPHLLTSQDNISIPALFTKWTGQKNLSLFLTSMVLLIMAILILILIHRGKSIRKSCILEGAVLLMLIPLVSPLGWDYTLLLSVLGLMTIIRHFFCYSNPWRAVLIVNLLVIGLSVYDLLGRELYSNFMSWSVITVNFLILLGFLFFLRIRRIA